MAKQKESKTPNELLGAIKEIKESLVYSEIGSPEYIEKLNELGEVQKALEVLVPDPQKYISEVKSDDTPEEKADATPEEKVETPEPKPDDTPEPKGDEVSEENYYEGLLKIDFSKIQKEGWEFIANMARRENFDKKWRAQQNAEPEIELSKEEVKALAKSKAQARQQAIKEKHAELVAIQEAEKAKEKEKK